MTESTPVWGMAESAAAYPILRNDTDAAATLRAADAAHHIHPFSDMAALNAEGTRIIVHGQGVWLTDIDGRRYLDAFSGLWNVNVGYGRDEIADAAHAQMRQLPFYNSFFRSTVTPAIELAQVLAELCPALPKVFFTNSGSEANDTIIRMVRHYWALRGKPKKSIIVGRLNGYHGSTVAAASLGGMKPMHEQGGLPIPGILHAPQPWWWGEGGDMSPDDFGLWAAREVARIMDAHPGEVAAFIGEPIQGAGGVVIPPRTYWPEIERICRERDVLLIADEVICGFGRTGHWFGHEYFGFSPDMVTIAKGITSGYLPLGGVLVSDKIAGVLAAGGDFNHGYTTSAHPACCAAALANLKILRDEKLVERVRHEIGPYLQAKWRTLDTHKLVGETRMVGLIGGVELTPDRSTRARFAKHGEAGTICRDFAYARGLILRATGDSMLVAPPFVLTEAEADLLVERVRLALDDTWAELSRVGAELSRVGEGRPGALPLDPVKGHAL